MNKSPNGTSSSKKSVTDDLVKDYMYLSEPFSDFFPPLALYLYKSVSQVLRAAAKHFGASGYACAFSICPPRPAAKGRRSPFPTDDRSSDISLREKSGFEYLSLCTSPACSAYKA